MNPKLMNNKTTQLNAVVTGRIERAKAYVESSNQNTQPEIPENLELIRNQTAHLSDLVATLEKRLSPILAPTRPEAAVNGEAVSCRTSLGEQLVAQAAQLRTQTYFLELILSRIEL